MCESPLVSVILPTYNRNNHLIDALNSVKDQKYDKIQVIVIDDHSQDPVRDSIPTHLKSGLDLNIIRHSSNKGQNAARNTGIRNSTGDLIALLDDDDIWLEEKLAKQVDAITSKEEYGVCYTGQSFIDQEGNIIGESLSTASGDVTQWILSGGKIAPTSSTIVSREAAQAAGLLDEDCPTWTDREWYIRLSQVCEFVAIPEPLVLRRREEGDHMSDNFELKKEISYPLFVDKYRSLASEYGYLCERKFMSHLSYLVGQSAVVTENYSKGREPLLRSIYYYPFRSESYIYLLLALGGKTVHKLARKAKRLYYQISR